MQYPYGALSNSKIKLIKRETRETVTKEIIVNTYKAIGKSVVNYAAPVWTQSLSDTNWKELNVAQNAALRVATGCVLMSATTHLNQETNILPVKEHNEMLTNQFYSPCTNKNILTTISCLNLFSPGKSKHPSLTNYQM